VNIREHEDWNGLRDGWLSAVRCLRECVERGGKKQAGQKAAHGSSVAAKMNLISRLLSNGAHEADFF
jgi:hypothetical protein